MRALSLLLLLATLPALGQGPSGVPYRIAFDSDRDVTMEDKDPKTGKEGLFITVRFTITLEGAGDEAPGTDYRIVIEEDGHAVREEDVPRPTPSDDLSIMLAIDTSGSMKEHGRMAQARAAAGLFLTKLPRKADCGLILFDHEMRQPVLPPILKREPLLAEIDKVQPRGGTAYLDAAARGIDILRGAEPKRERALVILTDGIDLNSAASADDVVAQAKKNKVRVYTIGIGEPGKLERVSQRPRARSFRQHAGTGGRRGRQAQDRRLARGGRTLRGLLAVDRPHDPRPLSDDRGDPKSVQQRQDVFRAPPSRAWCRREKPPSSTPSMPPLPPSRRTAAAASVPWWP